MSLSVSNAKILTAIGSLVTAINRLATAYERSQLMLHGETNGASPPRPLPTWSTPERDKLLREIFNDKRYVTGSAIVLALSRLPGPHVPAIGNVSAYAVGVLGLPPREDGVVLINAAQLEKRAAEWGIVADGTENLLAAVNAMARRIGIKPYELKGH